MFSKIMKSQTFWRIAAVVTFLALVFTIGNTTEDPNRVWWITGVGVLFLSTVFGMGFTSKVSKVS